MNQTGAPLAGFYDLRLIALSLLIAIFASHVALDLAVRVMVGRGTDRRAWLAGGAILMGAGVRSRPFVGMLAFTLLIPVRYDVPTVLLPLLVAILASVIGLEIASGARFIRREELAGSLAMGSGIAAMHCLGMAVMRLPCNIPWQPPPTGTVGRNCSCCFPGGADGCLQLSRGVSADVGKGNQRRGDDRRDLFTAVLCYPNQARVLVLSQKK